MGRERAQALSATRRIAWRRVLLVGIAGTIAPGVCVALRLRPDEPAYYKSVDDVVADKAALANKALVVRGCVAGIENRPGTNDFRILLRSEPARPRASLQVRYRGPLPPAVRTGWLLAVAGRLDGDGTLVASGDGLLTRCPAKYSAALPLERAACQAP
jgi:cytochrome c-type biogenesis protein CcmE